jgi:hypothetical protein
MALGAGRAGVIGMVLRGAMIQAALGLAIGVPIALLSVLLSNRSSLRSRVSTLRS